MRLEAGRRLGPYEIVTPLGAGGMGEVYRARDSRLEREVAIKVLPEHTAQDPQAVARFQREAKAVAALAHPNILAIYDVGEEDGISFAVTELLEGQTLRAHLARTHPTPAEATGIALAVAQGLSAAHSRGVIHRDLKPENIFLSPGGHVKILDFGLARRHGPCEAQDLSQATTETGTGAAIGTPAYMAPEQVRGEMVDARADLFSLGCVLYEMVAGRRAFDRGTVSDTLAAVLRDEPEPPRAAPPKLASVIARCLEKDRARRFQSAGDLIAALEAAVAQPAGTRQRRPWAPLVAAACAAVLLAIFLAWRLLPGKAIDSLAVLPFVNAAADPAAEPLTEGITESLITSLSRLPDLRVKSRDSVSRYKRQEKDPETAGRELGVRAILKGRLALARDTATIGVELIDARDGAVLWREQYQRPARELLAVQGEISREVSERLRPKLTGDEQKRLSRPQTDSSEAYQLYLMGRYRWNRRTEDTLKSSADFFQQAIEKDPNYARAWAGLADAHNLLGTYGVRSPAESYPRAKTAATRALQLDPTLAEAHASLGWLKSQYEWDWAGTEREYRRAIELNPEYATAHHWYAWYLAIVGRHNEAVASIQRARDLDPVSPVIHSRVGLFLYFAGRYDEALEQCRKSIDMDPAFAWGHNSLGSVYIGTGKHAEGIAELEKAAALSQRGVIELGYLGHAYALAGRQGDARKVLAELKDLAAKRYVPPLYVAVVHTGLGEKDAALDLLDKACGDRSLQSWYLPDHRLDPLRALPRFHELLRRMGLAGGK